MSTSWFISQLSPQTPGLWLLISILAGSLVFLIEDLPNAWRFRILTALWLLIPYCGLLFGGLSPRLMGLNDIDWSASLSLGLGLIFAVLVLLIVVRMAMDLTESGPVDGNFHLPKFGEYLQRAPGLAPNTWHYIGSTILSSGIEEFHWVFLRGALWEMLLSLPAFSELPAYWAIWLAAVIRAC